MAPRGANGGGPGHAGRNLLNGTVLPAKCRVTLQPGDVLTIETPGGGGWGAQEFFSARVAATGVLSLDDVRHELGEIVRDESLGFTNANAARFLPNDP